MRDTISCPACDGTGIVQEGYIDQTGDERTRHTICDVCGGFGKVYPPFIRRYPDDD